MAIRNPCCNTAKRSAQQPPTAHIGYAISYTMGYDIRTPTSFRRPPVSALVQPHGRGFHLSRHPLRTPPHPTRPEKPTWIFLRACLDADLINGRADRGHSRSPPLKQVTCMAFPWRCLVYADGSFYRTSNIGGSLDDYSDADLAHMTPSATRTKPRRGSRPAAVLPLRKGPPAGLAWPVGGRGADRTLRGLRRRPSRRPRGPPRTVFPTPRGACRTGPDAGAYRSSGRSDQCPASRPSAAKRRGPSPWGRPAQSQGSYGESVVRLVVSGPCQDVPHVES